MLESYTREIKVIPNARLYMYAIQCLSFVPEKVVEGGVTLYNAIYKILLPTINL